MARKSSSSLEVAPVTELDRRLLPPDGLTTEQAQVWASIVATKPADWFQADCAPILMAYCRHITAAKLLSDEIDRFQAECLP